MKNKIVAVLFIVVFVLLIAVVFSLLNDGQDVSNVDDVRLSTSETSSVVVSSVPTADTSSSALATAEPTLLPLPSETLAPTVAPTATPEPTPTPVPANTELGSGTFTSESPVQGLNLITDWKATTVDNDTVSVTVTVSTQSYSLHLEANQSLKVTFNGESVSLNTPAVTYDGTALEKNELASTTFTVSLPTGSSNSYTLTADWHFGGTYMNTAIENLTCTGTVSIVR